MAPPAASRKHHHRSRPLPRRVPVLLVLTLLAAAATVASAQLSSEDYYDASCPAALLTIRSAVATAVLLDRRACRLRAEAICDADVMIDRYEDLYEEMIQPTRHAARGRASDYPITLAGAA